MGTMLGVSGLTAATAILVVVGEMIGDAKGPMEIVKFLPALLVAAGCVAWIQLRSNRPVDDEPPQPIVAPQPPWVPSGLPLTHGFVGRRAEVAAIVGSVDPGHVVAVVGRRSVGTTACAVHAANQVRERFPDGQHYLNLRSHGRPMSGRQVVIALAGAMGVPVGRRAAADTITNALRAAVAQQRIVVVLDNVDFADQVRALLPPPPHCLLVLAGSTGLATLEGLHLHTLTEPSVADCVEIYREAAGERAGAVEADPAVVELVELCGRQPRAARGLGRHLATHGWPPSVFLAELRAELRTGMAGREAFTGRSSGRLLDMVASWDEAYLALDRASRRAYRLLALADAPVEAVHVRALTGVSQRRNKQALDALIRASFVTYTTHDQYVIRSPLEGYATVHLARQESPRAQGRARLRLIDQLVGELERHPARVPGVLARTDGQPGATGEQPWTWFDRHGSLLKALIDTPPRHRAGRTHWFRLVVAAAQCFAERGELDSWLAASQAVLDSPTLRENARFAGWAHNQKGVILRRRGELGAAAAELAEAVRLRTRWGAAQSRTNYGLVLLDQGDIEGALEQLRRARRSRGRHDHRGAALTDVALGAAYLAHGDPGRAREHLIAAANALDERIDPVTQAAALVNLGLALWRLNEPHDAWQAWESVRQHHTRTGGGDLDGQVAVLVDVGAALLTDVEPRVDEARAKFERALELVKRGGSSIHQAAVLLCLGDAAAAAKDPQQAVDRWKQARAAAEEVGDVGTAYAADRRLTQAVAG